MPLGSTSYQFRDTWYGLAPPWLRTGVGEKFMYVQQLALDGLMEKMAEGIAFRCPGQGDPSQIPYLAYDTQLLQGPNEGNPAFIGRLITCDDAWDIAGSRIAVLQQLAYYTQGMQPSVAGALPSMAIVGGLGFTVGSQGPVTTWDVLYQDSPLGSVPVHSTIVPGNFNWDGKAAPWRTWLVWYMQPIAVPGLSGTSGQTGTAMASLCFQSPGVSGPGLDLNGIQYSAVWQPAVAGTPVNHPWLTLNDLTGLTSAVVGKWITVSGSAHSGNNGVFQITAYNSATSCVIANPNGVASDTGPLTWSIAEWPFLSPGPAWGTPGVTFGEGAPSAPNYPYPDYGALVGGVWRPVVGLVPNSWPGASWNLQTAQSSAPYELLGTIRQLIQRWKSASAWYVDIVVSFSGGTGVAGSGWSPLSTVTTGNPDGQFGSAGHLGTAVSSEGITYPKCWVPRAPAASPYDAYCEGGGTWAFCSVKNQT